MAAEAQPQAISGDQDQCAAIAGVRGEFPVPLDIGETQAPGKILSDSGLAGDFAGEPASISPGHGMIGFVSADLESGLLFAFRLKSFSG